MLTSETQDAESDLRMTDRQSGVEDTSQDRAVSSVGPRRLFRISWLGQTMASLCWIVSVFVYGISSAGDLLQLAAASAWLIANIADLVENDG